MLSLGNLLDRIKSKDPFLGVVIQKLQTAVNNLARNSGQAVSGHVDPPPMLEAVNVKANAGLVHISLTHNAAIQKGIQYYTEYDTNPAFPQPHVVDMGASRSHFVSLPAKDDNGVAHSWYFRSYAQYPGSKATQPIIYGGGAGTPVNVGGSTQLTPLASTGSGTASGNGQSGGQGAGHFLLRPAAKE